MRVTLILLRCAVLFALGWSCGAVTAGGITRRSGSGLAALLSVQFGASKQEFFAEMKSRFGAEAWKCLPTRTRPGVEAESCQADVQQADKEVAAGWVLEAVPFQGLLGVFEGERLVALSYLVEGGDGLLAWRRLQSNLTAKFGVPDSSVNSLKRGEGLGTTWIVRPDARILLWLPSSVYAAGEVWYAREDMLALRLPESMRAALLGPSKGCKRGTVDVCDLAREFSSELARQLPLRISREVIVSHVVSDGPEVVLVVELAYTNQELDEQLSKSGASRDQMLAAMTNSVKEGACKKGSPRRWFLDQGGRFRYDYRGHDGVLVVQVPIMSC